MVMRIRGLLILVSLGLGLGLGVCFGQDTSSSNPSLGVEIEVTVEEKLEIALAESRYWQAVLGAERAARQAESATRELQSLISRVEARCIEAGGTFEVSGGVEAIKCLKLSLSKPNEAESN